MSGSGVVDRALADCVNWHRGQLRRLTGAPYATHPIDVCKHLSEAGVAEADVLAAALLHDCVEDTSATLAQIEAGYGAVVAGWVDELTIPAGQAKSAYLAGFANASIAALLIKLADRYCNVQDWLSGGDRARATVYAGRAAALLRAVEARQHRIDERFGPITGANARAWLRELGEIAAGQLPPARGLGLRPD